MRASLFEIWKLTQRTLEAAGVPDGYDREGAYAVQWLCEHGFPGFELFGAVTPEISTAWHLSISGDAELQASATPLVATGVDVIDFCAAAATEAQGAISIVVRAALGPIFLLPFAVRRCLNSGACRINWSLGEGHAIQIAVGGAGSVWIDAISSQAEKVGGDELFNVDTPFDVTVTFDYDGAALRAEEDAPPGELLSPNTLKARRAATLAHGVDVTPELWSRMADAARAVLVPTTALSHNSGAGGGNAND